MQYQTPPYYAGLRKHLALLFQVAALTMLLGISARAAILRVDTGNNSGTQNGTSWATAYKNIQAAVDASSAGDEIWVAAGTYNGTGDHIVVMAENVSLYGGFSGTETQRSQRNWVTNITTIDGNHERRGLLGAEGSRLDGFTVTRGGGQMNGGGMYNEGVPLNELFMSIANCAFIDNHSINGGAIYNKSSNIEIINCTFSQNGALQGGGVYNINSAPVITACSFTENSGVNLGGAMYNASSDAVISNCYFIGNTVEYVMDASKGAGIYGSYSRLKVTNCVFRDNEADGFGGGIYASGSGYSPTIINCSFSGNEAGDKGGGIWTNGEPVIKNCILWGNSAENSGSDIYLDSSSPVITYSCINGLFPGTGNLNTNPKFAGPADLSLQAGSPCIDAGTSAGAPSTDIVGQSRPIGDGWDMGAYEMPETVDEDVLEKQDRIVFPASFTALDPILGNTWVGATAMNINTTGKPITFLGKDSSGNNLSTNSSLPSLNARGQLANLTSELVTLTPQVKTIIGEGNGQNLPLRGIFVLGDSQTKRLDGIGHQWITGKTLYLLNGWEKTGQATIVHIYNPSLSEQAEMLIEWIGPDGSIIDDSNQILPAEGTLFQPLSDIFNITPGNMEGYLKITSSTEICGFILNGTAQAFIAFPAQLASETEALYAPHFILLPDGSGTELQLVNAGTVPASVVFLATDDTGQEYESQGQILEAGEMMLGSITEFIPLNPEELDPNQILTGRIKVTVSAAGGSGANPMVLGGITLNGSPYNSAGLPLEKEGWKKTIFPHIAQSTGMRIFTGLAIWNKSSLFTNITVKAWNQSGQVTATKVFSLAPGLRRVGLLNEDFYFGSSFSQVGGHLEGTSSQDVICFCLYGDFDMVYLSTIGGQKVD